MEAPAAVKGEDEDEDEDEEEDEDKDENENEDKDEKRSSTLTECHWPHGVPSRGSRRRPRA